MLKIIQNYTQKNHLKELLELYLIDPICVQDEQFHCLIKLVKIKYITIN